MILHFNWFGGLNILPGFQDYTWGVQRHHILFDNIMNIVLGCTHQLNTVFALQLWHKSQSA